MKGLVRLHFSDTSVEWHAKIAQALAYARDASVASFLVFSAAYMRPGTVVRTV